MNLTAIFIVGICCWALVSLVNGPRSRKKDKQENQQNLALEAEVATLKERIEVLEKIVTDEKYDLNKQFEDLKKDRVA